MALDETAAGASIGNGLLNMSESDKNDPVKVWTKACELLFAHFKANAVVTITPGSATAGGDPVVGGEGKVT